jgi:hypothetical protein
MEKSNVKSEAIETKTARVNKAGRSRDAANCTEIRTREAMIIILLRLALQYCYREFTSQENALTSEDGTNYLLVQLGLWWRPIRPRLDVLSCSLA